MMQCIDPLMIAPAEVMVRERRDHVAIPDVVSVAMRRDAVKFFLQKSKFADLVAHLLQLSVGDMMGIGTRALRVGIQREKFPDCLNCEAEIARMLDEGETLAITGFIASLIAL